MQQTLQQYAWKLVGLAKGIDIDAAVQELGRIESLYGSLTPENVLDASRPEKATVVDKTQDYCFCFVNCFPRHFDRVNQRN